MPTLKTHKGIVTQLRKAKGYADPVFTQTDKTLAGTAAVGAAAMQQFFNSASLASSSMGAEFSVECFTCLVNGLPLTGHFYKVGFTEGEEVEFVIEEKHGGGIVHAARSPSQRILWMLPYQTRGHVAQKKSDWKWTWILSISVAIISFVILEIRADPYSVESLESRLVVPIMMLFIALFVNIMSRRSFTKFAKSTNEVLGAFGYLNPEQVDLYKEHSIATKKLKLETGKSPDFVDLWSFRY